MSSTNRGAQARRDADWYPTPSWCVRALLDVLDLPPGIWLEPAVGEGAIVCAVEMARPDERRRWVTCDVRRTNAAQRVRDFLAPPAADEAALDVPAVIVTNPPFSHALPFARRCLEISAGRAWVVLLLRLGFLESLERAGFLVAHPPDLYPLARRPSFTGGSDTDSAAYGWFVWPPGPARSAGVLHPPIGAHVGQLEFDLELRAPWDVAIVDRGPMPANDELPAQMELLGLPEEAPAAVRGLVAVFRDEGVAAGLLAPSGPAPAKKERPARPLPEGWAPDSRTRILLVERGIDPAAEVAAYRLAMAGELRKAWTSTGFRQWSETRRCATATAGAP
jgi:hypothetical protein